MKSACQVPIRLTSYFAQTAPRGVLAAVPFDHHHSLLPLHLIAARLAPSVLFRLVGPIQLAGAAL